MAKRKIKFRAWIPDLEIMLDEITLYGNGQMGYDDEFRESLPKDHELDYDYAAVIKNFIDEDGDEDFEKITPVLLGEDWIWLEEVEFEPMQFTGLIDKTGKEIYEGDWIKLTGGLRLGFYPDNGQIIFNEHSGFFVMKALNDSDVYMNFSLGYSDGTEIEVIGNVYQNPNQFEKLEAGGKN